MRYIFTEEWDEGNNLTKYEVVCAYGKREESLITSICEQMERYSPYDYACPCIFDTKQEYLRAIRFRMEKGCRIHDHEVEL